MTKLKLPLLSLGAHGTIANQLTYQERFKSTMVRRKPIPTGITTLAQTYQRWLYQDYVAWWHTLSTTTQALYETLARPYHMTGFAYWMKDRLLTLPDIAGDWHLDEHSGNIAIDFSRNTNQGTIYGAQHVPGLIDYALSLDGVDDYVNCSNNISLRLTGPFTLEVFLYKRADTTLYPVVLDNGKQALLQWGNGQTQIQLWMHDGTAWETSGNSGAGTVPYNAWTHIVGTWDGSRLKIYTNGVLRNQSVDLTGSTPRPFSDNTIIGSDNAGAYDTNGIIDEARVYTRALTLTDIERHSLRRYPA